MKKILVVSMSAQLGGIEKSLINFLNFLDKKECEVDLLLWKKQGELLASIPHKVNMVDCLTPGNLSVILAQKNYKKIPQYIKLKVFTVFNVPWKAFKKIDKKYDIAISYTQDGYSPYFVIDKVNSDKKFLWYHHGAYAKRDSEIKKDSRYYGEFSKIITVSKSNQDMLTNIFGGIQNKFKVIKNLIGEEQIATLSRETCNVFKDFDGCKITTVGRISREKGQLNSLDVAKELKNNGFRFKWCFVGDGPDMALCKDKVKAFGLENECVFMGSKVNPYPYIEAADLYVQLSFVEADPVTIQEALVLNKVIIASDIAPMKEALGDASCGMLCSTDSQKASEAIIKVANNYSLQKQYVSAIENQISRNELIEEELSELLGL